MNKTRSPPWKKQTPTYHPELLEIWQKLYNELFQTHKKWRALQIIADKYGIHPTSVEYHLFPQRREQQKKYQSRRWTYEKANPLTHKKRIDYKARYMAARRHIDDLVKECSQRIAPQDAISMEDLSYAIHDNSNILFKPETLLGLVKRLEATKRCPVLEEVFGYSVPHYRLSDKKRK